MNKEKQGNKLKKRITAIIFILLLIGSVVWMITEGTKTEVLPLGSKIPKLNLITQDCDTTISNTNNKTLVIFFSKACPHCKYELNVLNNNINKLQDTRIYLITIDKDLFKDGFVKGFTNLVKSNNCIFGIVDREEIITKIGSSTLPTLFFFDNKGKLTAKISGETKFERILSELKIEN